jgi:SAM-dependent methyltransferase
MDYKTKKFDLDWGDEGVVPEIVFPDTMFIFKRMGEVILEMAAPVNGERVLDVGCGRAIDALQFAKSGALAIGLDPSSKMMLGAKSFLNDNSGDNVDLVRAIGEGLPFKNRSLHMQGRLGPLRRHAQNHVRHGADTQAHRFGYHRHRQLRQPEL